MIKRFLGTASALLLAVALFVPGQAEARSLDEILESGEIRVGVNPTLPPLSFSRWDLLGGAAAAVGHSPAHTRSAARIQGAVLRGVGIILDIWPRPIEC